jgi:hypothetical protein
MDDVKKVYREGEQKVKEAVRGVDGTDLKDQVGNAGDQIRKDAGNAGDDMKREYERQTRDTEDMPADRPA